MADSEPLIADVLRFDAAILASDRHVEASREVRGFATAAEGTPGATDHLLLLAGTARVEAETPYGPFEVYSIGAPCFLNLSGPMLSNPARGPIQLQGPSAFVRLSAEEMRRLVAAESPLGAAYRRMALVTLVRSIRRINQGLNRFFPGPEGKFSASSIERAVAEAMAGYVDRLSPPAEVPTPAPSPPRPREAPEAHRADFKHLLELMASEGLSASTLMNLGLLERTYRSGDPLALAGEPADEAFLVYDGRIRVSVRIPNAGVEALGICGKGDFVGEMALVDDAPRSADLHAHEDPVSVFVLTRGVFRKLLDEGPPGSAPLMAHLTFALCRRLEESVQRSVSFFMMAGGLPSDAPGPGLSGLPDEGFEDEEFDFEESPKT